MRAAWLALAFLLLPAARASAEWQIKPFFAATFGGGTTLAPFVVEQVGEVKRTFGVSGVFVGEIVGIEGDVALTPGFFQTGKGHLPFSPGEVTLNGSSVATITGNVVIAAPRRLTEYTLRPYFVGGAGVMRARTEPTESQAYLLSSNWAAFDIGGGAAGFLSDRYGVSWDVRYFHSLRGKTGSTGLGVGAPEQLSFWRVNMAFVVRLRHKTR